MRKCNNCGKDVSRRGAKAKYCDYNCYDEKRRGKWTEKSCEICSKKFRCREKGKWKKFCGNKCQAVAFHRKKTAKIREQLFEVYGDECECCNETTKEFLTLEHKRGDGRLERKTMTNHNVWLKAIREKDHSRYGILCMNCNWAKGKFGRCPHERRSD